MDIAIMMWKLLVDRERAGLVNRYPCPREWHDYFYPSLKIVKEKPKLVRKKKK